MFDYSADVIKVEQVDRGDDTSASIIPLFCLAST